MDGEAPKILLRFGNAWREILDHVIVLDGYPALSYEGGDFVEPLVNPSGAMLFGDAATSAWLDGPRA